MAQDRVSGTAQAGAWYGYSPLVVQVACDASGFLADSVDGDGVITEQGFSKAVATLETFGSVVWLGAQSDTNLAAIVDGPSFNKGAAGDYAELATALGAVVDAGNVTVTTSAELNGDGTFTLA